MLLTLAAGAKLALLGYALLPAAGTLSNYDTGQVQSASWLVLH